MLRCEIAVPALFHSYEFSLNEHVRIPALIAEIMSVIEDYEGCKWVGGAEKAEDAEEAECVKNAVLCDAVRGRILPREKTLYECNVTPGSKLILV